MRNKKVIFSILSVIPLAIYADFVTEDAALREINAAIATAARDETKLTKLEQVYREATNQYPNLVSRLGAQIDLISYLKQMRDTDFKRIPLNQILIKIDPVTDVIKATRASSNRTPPTPEILDRANTLLRAALERLLKMIADGNLDATQLQQIKQAADSISMPDMTDENIRTLLTNLRTAVNSAINPTATPQYVTPTVAPIANVATAVSDINAALDEAEKDFAKIAQAQAVINRAKQQFPQGNFADLENELIFLSTLSNMGSLSSTQLPALQAKLLLLFDMWNRTKKRSVQDKAIKLISDGLENIENNALKWDKTLLPALKSVLDDLNRKYFRELSFAYRTKFINAQNALNNALPLYPTPQQPAPAVPYVPYVPPTPSAPPAEPTPTTTPAPGMPFKPAVMLPSTPPTPDIQPPYIYTPSVTPTPTRVTPKVTPGVQTTHEQNVQELQRLQSQIDWLRRNMPA